MDYILGEDKPQGCIFCPEAGEDLAERLILFRGRLTRIMMNKYPYINGHLLISPQAAHPGPGHLTPEENLDLMVKLRAAMAILKRLMRPDGFNVGLNLGVVAGAGVEEPSPLSRGAPLERRHQFHPGLCRRPGDPGTFPPDL